MSDPRTLSSASGPRLRLGTALRLLGAALAALLVWWQWGRVVAAGQVLASGDRGAWALAAALQFVCLLVASYRFSLLLRGVKIRIPLRTLFADLVCTTALNTAFLMGVGDLYRLKQTNRSVDNVTLCGALIIIDRIIGFGSICAVALLTSAFLKDSSFRFPTTFLLVGLAVAVLGIGLARRFARSGKLAVWNDMKRPVLALVARPALTAYATLVSLALMGLWLTSIVVIARGLGIQAPITAIAFAASAVTLATIMPISIGGIGVREAGYTILLAGYGVQASQAIALGVAQYALFLPIIAAGAILGTVRDRGDRGDRGATTLAPKPS